MNTEPDWLFRYNPINKMVQLTLNRDNGELMMITMSYAVFKRGVSVIENDKFRYEKEDKKTNHRKTRKEEEE